METIPEVVERRGFSRGAFEMKYVLPTKMNTFILDKFHFCAILFDMRNGKRPPSYSEQSRVGRKRAQVRMALLTAARQVLTTRGYREATITEIVQLADVASGTFYLHFRDKEDLFSALVQEEVRTIFEQIQTAIDDQPPEHVLATVIRVALAQAYQQRELFVFACTEATVAHAIMHSAQTHLEALLLPVVQRAQEQGRWQANESMLLAHLITGMVVQGISWWFEQDEPGPDVMADSILSLLEQGFPSALLDLSKDQS
jgi:AcrR family transcriptional regulator